MRACLALSRLSLCLVLSSSFSFLCLCLSKFCLFCLALLSPSSDWYRTSGFLYFGHGEVFADVSI
jgi:hypothetical protein